MMIFAATIFNKSVVRQMISRLHLHCVVAVVGICLSSSAAAQAPVNIEGRLTGVNLAARTIKVMGLDVYISTGTIIRTPVARIGLKALLGNPFPGRSDRGFLNGVAIVSGSFTNGAIQATTVDVVTSENVLQGPVTWVNGELTIFGKPLRLITDERLPGKAVNEVGFPVDLNTAPADADTIADGYEGSDGVFYAHTVDCSAAKVQSGFVATTISTARSRDAGRLELRGATSSQSGKVTIYNADTNSTLGTASVVVTAGYGTYGVTFSKLAMVPARVRVVHTNGSSATSVVER